MKIEPLFAICADHISTLEETLEYFKKKDTKGVLVECLSHKIEIEEKTPKSWREEKTTKIHLKFTSPYGFSGEYEIVDTHALTFSEYLIVNYLLNEDDEPVAFEFYIDGV